MKKVLFVINTMGTGGAEKALLEMLEHLKGQDLSIDLYVLLGRGELMILHADFKYFLSSEVRGIAFTS